MYIKNTPTGEIFVGFLDNGICFFLSGAETEMVVRSHILGVFTSVLSHISLLFINGVALLGWPFWWSLILVSSSSVKGDRERVNPGLTLTRLTREDPSIFCIGME